MKSKPTKAKKRTAQQVRWDAQLAAGGMVAASAKVDQNATEKVVARRYTGAALGGRVVVRLSADRLGPAEDLAMEFLGLQPAGESKPIGQQSRQALGFASWALIHHPENAKDALVLVKRIKAAARKAKSKPGHAMDAFVEMAGELNRSVRHFLPPFWEEAARIYKDLGNTTYAGRAIGKALEAERVHSLAVDPIRRRDAVLEFTLSGCLSGKALTEYTRDLANQFEPAEAFETLLDLMVRRTMGGMPPMATAAKDLAKFAKAADRDPDTEVDAFLLAVISSPAMSRTSMQFWKSVKKNVARIVKQDDTFAMWLLAHTDPQSSYQGDSPVWAWLDLLDTWNVLPLLGRPTSDLPEDVEIPGGRAGWIGRLASVESSPNSRVFDLIALTADVIRDEAVAIALDRRGYYGGVLDVDVIELMLELELPIAVAADHRELNFDGWLRADVDHDRRNSQLTHVIADERFGPKVYSQLESLVTFTGSTPRRHSYGRAVPAQRSFEAAAADHAAVRELWWRFLDDHVKNLESGGLCDVEESLNVLAKCAGRTTGEQFPELGPRLSKVDFVAALTRTLAAGVLDEYGWPALDAFGDERKLPRISEHRSKAVASFPYLTMVVDGKVESFGPDGHQTLGEFQLEKDQHLEKIIRVRDDAVIGLLDRGTGYEYKLAWLSEGGQAKATSQYFYGLNVDRMMPCDGGVFYGTRVLHSGDDVLPESQHWFSDGERFWNQKNLYRAWNEFDTDEEESAAEAAKRLGLQEIDPATGKAIRDSVPAWFEQNLPAGGKIHWTMSHLMPAPSSLKQSPLGVAGGMLGLRVVRRRDQQFESCGVDGRRVVLAPSADAGMHCAAAIVDRPASDSYWCVSNQDELIDIDSGIRIASLKGNLSRYREGQPIGLPPLFLHFFQIRCAASSTKLRKVTAAQSKKLFAAGAVEHEALKIKEDPKHPDANRTACATAVSKLLPKAPPRLVRGVARIARLAAVEQISLDKLTRAVMGIADEGSASTATESKKKTPLASDKAIGAGLSELFVAFAPSIIPQSYRGRYHDTVDPKQLTTIVDFLRGGDVETMPKGDNWYFGLIDDAAAVAWKVFWQHAHEGADAGTPVGKRLTGAWLDALRFIADGGLLDLPGKLVVHVAAAPDKAAAKKLGKAGKYPSDERPAAFVEAKTRHIAYKVGNYMAEKVVILSYAESGNPKPPKSFVIEHTVPLQKRWGGDPLRRFVDAVGDVETLPLIPAEMLDAAAEKLGVTPIEVALGWMGNFRTVAYGQEKLTKELRSHYGWKVNEIKAAVVAADADPVSLSVVAEGCRRSSVGALGKSVELAFRFMVDAWQQARKVSVKLPADLIGKMQSVRAGYQTLNTKLLCDLLADPAASPVLQPRELHFAYGTKYRQQVLSGTLTPPMTFSIDAVLPNLPAAIAFVNYQLPHGDEARKKIPALIDAVREYLDNPNVVLPMGCRRTEPYHTDQTTDVDGTIEKFSAMIAKCEQTAEGFYTFDSGLIVGAVMPPAVDQWFRPARLHTDKEDAALLVAAALTFDWETDGTAHLQFAEMVRAMRGEELTNIRQGNRDDDSSIAEGQWEQDPRISAADTVAKVKKKLKVSEDAAALYLQILALHDCTNANLKRWNGWTTTQLKAATSELVESEYLVSAKRSRAGRDAFLPGGWEPLKLPNLPIESWKLTMFGYENTDRLRGGYANLIVCPRRVGDQFRLAWQRVCDGDPPKYEETL
ncbi:DNA-binding protein [Allorhodopirellula solitaria]|uniref:DNA-binding protein n=1 Tax=Allorhodopirellula solitaria TaxID=2527987 RepID=UPI0016451670|nr:DNA-binding protein [Allorhodopirellula solitaria]